jgi:hypothetical protein
MPVRDLAVPVLHVDVKLKMRIAPLDFSDDSLDDNRFARVIPGGRRMMRHQRHSGCEQAKPGDGN